MKTDLIKIIEALDPLLLAYPRSGMGKDNIKIYAMALSDVKEDLLKVAIVRCIQNCQFFPSVAEIRKQAEALLPSDTLSSSEAWEQVQKIVKSHWVTEKPVIDNPDLAKAIARFGWREFYSVQEGETGIARAQFTKIYDQIIARKIEDKRNEKVFTALGNRKDEIRQLITGLANG